MALRSEAPPVLDPFSDASAVDGHDALSRASTGKTDNTRSSGLERNMRDFEVTMDDAASPRFSKRMTLVVANPSSSASGDDGHSM